MYYHVADNGYQEGDDLWCYAELESQGYSPTWKWDEWCEGLDTDIVCLFESLDEAREFQATYGGRVLAVDVPDDARIIRNDEGYPCIGRCIPSAWISGEIRGE